MSQAWLIVWTGCIPRARLEKFGIDAEFVFKSEIESVVSKAESLAKDRRIPNSAHREILVETPRYLVSRMLAEIGGQ